MHLSFLTSHNLLFFRFCKTSKKTTFSVFLSFFLVKSPKSQSLKLNISRTARTILMILVSFCRILNGFSDEINLFWRCSSPLMKAKSSLNSICSSHIKRRLSLITRVLVNTRPILLLVVSLTSLLAQSRLYKGELCLLRVQYHSLLGHSQGVTQRRIKLTESSVSLLTGTFPRLLNYRGGQVVLFNIFSLLGQAQVAILHRR